MNNNTQKITRRVLFVDDEPKVLQGLGRILRSERNHFETSFATSGREALSILAKEHFDVVITDMKMPEMNGLQLLSEIKTLYPDIVRIILSGESDLNMTMKSVSLSHQFLNKPCSPETLKSTILRTCRLSDFLKNDSLKKALTQIDTLPSMPSIYIEVTDELQSPNASIQKVGKIISQDVALTSKILQLVNSAYFSLPRHISSPEHAAVMLGLDIIRSLILVVQIFKKFELMDMPNKFFELLWAHNVMTGKIAKSIAKNESRDQKIIDNAFIAGLLHDSGKLILASSFPEEYRDILKKTQGKWGRIWEIEEDILGITHAEVGAYLMELWGLPVSIIEALAFHHSPSMSGEVRFSPLTAVYIANILEHGIPDTDHNEPQPVLDSAYLADLNLNNRLKYWEEIKQNIVNGDY
jgi:HD-like signal output (HDOD) protein